MVFRKTKIKNRLQANAALITVIAFLGVFSTIGLSILIQTIDFSVTANDYYRRSIVTNYINSCLDESLYRIDQDNSFSGNFTLEFEEGNSTCDATITSTGLTEFEINITATRTSSNNILNENYILDISGDNFDVNQAI